MFIISCSDDDAPLPENEEEEIAEVVLTFTPVSGGTPLSFTWADPDGEGPQNPTMETISLAPNTEYLMAIELMGPNDEDITEEIAEEDDEHMFFFGWTEGLFSSPSGSGNIAARSGMVNYEDADANNQPVGLRTRWTTGDAAAGTFRVVLKHQPGAKSATSTVEVGESDVDITWAIAIQ
ncbi:hypothetical protein [Cesiribacter andamanensis]|uniref:Type 1 periplasmic binding fold superfamily protein n=1 Tax=Cesiribacter andamanensis AMV16 TaxID=1279009 RepID=M7NRU7_9BACT|nr:hypothetical protein [Cesiribacter andamanensis]EMR01209.1 hypothetical protein ADICEAN_03662 [Cesiribacter andamanensis AMV16]